MKFFGVRYCGDMRLHEVAYENGRCRYCAMEAFWLLILEVLCILCYPLAFVVIDVVLWEGFSCFSFVFFVESRAESFGGFC